MKIRKVSDARWDGKINWTAEATVPGLDGTPLTHGEVVRLDDGKTLAVRFRPVTWDGKKEVEPVIKLEGRPSLQALVDQVRAAEDAKEAEERARDAEVDALPDSAFDQNVQADVGKAFFRKRDGRWLTVVGYKRKKVWDNYEDDWKWDHVAGCRPATAAEIEAAEVVSGARARAKAAAAELDAIAGEIRATGESPAGPVDPEAGGGHRVNVGDGQSIYGGGSWFVLGADGYVWFVRNNGGDGDDWSCNNVRTGGAGAIGWRVASTPELVGKIRTLSETAKGASR